MDWSQWGPGSISHPARKAPRKVAAHVGLVLEDVQSGFVGEVIRTERSGGVRVLELEDGRGARRSFPAGFGFWIDGEPVEIVEPASIAEAEPVTKISASGSVYVEGARAKTARAARIWVEGIHDAALIEKVWGHDLRVEGIVVEPMHGADDLASLVEEFAPTQQRRLAILLDHLVEGSKEARIAAEAMRVPGAREHVLIVGHPFVDVWEAVKPEKVGLRTWPQIPRGQDWKRGMLRHLGWPAETDADVGAGFSRILESVSSYADLRPELLGKVEHMIDFVSVED